MPRITDIFLDNIVFLYPRKEEAAQRAKIGGTGFILSKPLKGSKEILGYNTYVSYVITNKHVVNKGGGHPVISVNMKDGSAPDIWEYECLDWTTHPTADLAAICVHGTLDTSIHKISITSEQMIATPEIIDNSDIGIGDEVFMGGRFINHQGTKINQPAARFGSISMMLEEIYNPETRKQEPSFVVEMRSRTGFSGAPVIVYRTLATSLKEVPVKHFSHLLGVNWGYIKDEETQDNTFLNGVVPAWRITELLNDPALKQKQEDAEKDFAARFKP